MIFVEKFVRIKRKKLSFRDRGDFGGFIDDDFVFGGYFLGSFRYRGFRFIVCGYVLIFNVWAGGVRFFSGVF